jgi:hypothetical protein
MVSPAGKVVRVRVRPKGRNVWRGVATFPTAGLWIVRVANYAQRGFREAFGSRQRIVVRVTTPRAIRAPTGFPSLGRSGCSPASPARAGEVFGTAIDREQLWAMPIMPGGGAAWARPDRAEFVGLTGREIKIVFAMTSVAAPFVAVGPGGESIEPVWRRGHLGPTWVGIPGHQWGAGFVFPRPGCWRIRAGPRGDLWFLIRS